MTSDSEMTDNSPLQATRPPTPAESLRKLYSPRTLDSSESSSATSDEGDDSTSDTTVTDVSKLSAGRMSTSSAKIRELDAVIQRQHKLAAKKEAKSSERISSIERQLHRIHDLDSKLDEVQTDFGARLNLFEARMVESVTSNMTSNLQQMLAVVNKLSASKNSKCDDTVLSITEVPVTVDPSSILRNELGYHTTGSSSDSASSSSSNLNGTSSSSNSSLSVESSSKIQSPDHKRPRSKKKLLKPSIRRHLDAAMEAAGNSPPSSPFASQSTTDSLDHAMQQVDEILKTDFSSTAVHTVLSKTDPESQYTAKSTSHEDSKQSATYSLDRESVI